MKKLLIFWTTLIIYGCSPYKEPIDIECPCTIKGISIVEVGFPPTVKYKVVIKGKMIDNIEDDDTVMYSYFYTDSLYSITDTVKMFK